ncbi:MAG: site-2 protease family protein, partial [Bdellovibrionota bacterium]
YNGTPTPTWELLESLFEAEKTGNAFNLKIVDADGKNERQVAFTKSGLTLADEGIHSTELFIDKPAEKSPAEAAGILPGDRLVKVSGETIGSFFGLKDGIQRAGEKNGKVDIEWERNAKAFHATIDPIATSSRDPVLKKITQYTIGVIPMMSWNDPAVVIERIWNPVMLVYKGTERMVVFTWRNFVSLKKMLTGDVSVATLGGPILIGKIAGESISRGLIAFLSTMAVLSVGLGVLNILPIPVLDGGHLMLLTIEIFRKRPLTILQMEVVQQVGLSLILLLMVIVIKNDLTRLPLFQ